MALNLGDGKLDDTADSKTNSSKVEETLEEKADDTREESAVKVNEQGGGASMHNGARLSSSDTPGSLQFWVDGVRVTSGWASGVLPSAEEGTFCSDSVTPFEPKKRLAHECRQCERNLDEHIILPLGPLRFAVSMASADACMVIVPDPNLL
jgi:hypothetical protein